MEPKKFYNPTDKDIEITYDGRGKIFKAGKVKIVNGNLANHIIVNINSQLKVVDDDFKPEEIKDGDSKPEGAEKLSWKELRRKANEMGFYKVGMKKVEIIARLNEQKA